LLFIFERKSPQQMMRRVPRRPTEELCDGWPTSTHVCRFGTSSDPKVVMLSSATAPTLQVQRSLLSCTCSLKVTFALAVVYLQIQGHPYTGFS